MFRVRTIKRLPPDGPRDEFRNELSGRRPAGGWGYSKKHNLIHWRIVDSSRERLRFRPAASYFLGAVPILVFLVVVWALIAIVTTIGVSSSDSPPVTLAQAILAMTSLVDFLIALVVLPMISKVWARFDLVAADERFLTVRKSGWWISKQVIPIKRVRAITYGSWPKNIGTIPVQDTASVSRTIATVWIWDVTLQVEDNRMEGVMAPVGLWVSSQKSVPAPDERPPEPVVAVGRWLQNVTGKTMQFDGFRCGERAGEQ